MQLVVRVPCMLLLERKSPSKLNLSKADEPVGMIPKILIVIMGQPARWSSVLLTRLVYMHRI